jgi:hypothetical protein
MTARESAPSPTARGAPLLLGECVKLLRVVLGHPSPEERGLPLLLRRVWIGICVALTLLYFGWTTFVSFNEVPRLRPPGHYETDHFNLLARGFLNGHLHLAAEVPKPLLEAKNPYDPKSRGPVEVLHDASLYEGKYYIYFGPAPVVTLFLPFSAAVGRDLPLSYGVLIFSSGTFLFLTATFLYLQRRHFPRANLLVITAGVLALGAGSMLVALLQRPHIWELAAASGLFYFSLAIYCLVRAIHSPRAATWTACGGLALGFAVASRPTWIVCSVLFALPLLMRPARADRPHPYGWRALFAAAATCTAVVIGLFGYNYARFGDPFEFGQRYQLSAIIEGDANHFSPSYAAWNFRTYFLSALRWTTTFPFHHGIALQPSPPGHGGYEHSFGLFTNLPFALLALGVIATLARRRCRDTSDSQLRASLGAFAGAALISAGLLLCFFGNCVRYMADFSPWFMLLSACGVLLLHARISHLLFRRFVVGAAFALALFSAARAGLGVVNIASPERRPAAYAPLARVLDFPAFYLRTRNTGAAPQELAVSFPASTERRQETLLFITRAGRPRGEVIVDYLAPDQVRLGYREPTAGPFFSPTFAVGVNSARTLQLSLGTHYPDYDGAKFALRVAVDGWPLWHAPVISLEALGADVELGGSGDTRFTGRIHASRTISDAALPSPTAGGARIRFTHAAQLAGRSLPLATSGRAGAGDVLFLKVDTDGTLRLGYDHWADRQRFSAPLVSPRGREHTLEVWLPLAAPPAPDGKDRELLVVIDGVEHWRERVPHFAADARTLSFTQCPIGGTACEPMFSEATLEATQLPYPLRSRQKFSAD